MHRRNRYARLMGNNGGAAEISYLSRLALNASNTAPLTALQGTAATQVATSAVVVPDNLGVLQSITANNPAIVGARYLGSNLWSDTTAGGAQLGTKTTLASGLAKYAGFHALNSSGGVLIEPSATNLCLQSQTFGTTWTQTNTDIAVNTIAAPDGTTTADTLTALADNATVVQTPTATTAVPKCWSLWIKRKTGTGAISLSLDGGSTYTEKTITAEWVRFNIVQTIAAHSLVIKLAVNTDAIYVWGSQLEASTVPTSYIATTTTAVTRAVRYETIPGTNLGSKVRLTGEVNEVGREQWLLGCPTCGAGIYVSSANKVVWRGVSLGSELNSDTAFDNAGLWTAGANWSVATGDAVATGANGTTCYRAMVGLTAGKPYAATIVVSSYTGGTLQVIIGANIASFAVSAPGTYSVNIVPTGAVNSFGLRANGATTATVTSLSLKEVKEITSVATISANTPFTVGVKNDATGATLSLNGTDATDATMTTPVTWGTTVRIGTDTATTPANVLNGSVTVHLSSSDAAFNAGGTN